MTAHGGVSADRAYLTACVDRLRGAFQGGPSVQRASEHVVAQVRERSAEVPALDRTVEAFGLSPFERDVLLLAAAPELDPGFTDAIARAQGEKRPVRPSLGIAMSYLDDPDWSALTPRATLRRWGLVELAPGPVLMQRALLCPERMFHHLLGSSVLEPELAARVGPVPVPTTWPASREPAVQRCATIWSSDQSPIVAMVGRRVATLVATAAAAAARVDGQLLRLRLGDAPSTPEARARFLTMLGLEMALQRSILLVDAFEGAGERGDALRALVEDVEGPVVVVSREPVDLGRAEVQQVEVSEATFAEQRAVWEGVLAGASEAEVDRFVTTFGLEPESIATIGARAATSEGAVDPGAVWRETRSHLHPSLQQLAQPMRTVATFDDLVLPELQRSLLGDICDQVRHRAQVYERWGFSGRSDRGLGVAVLFAGPSGTGKTLAAEVLANQLDLDLFRIELPRVVGR